MSESSEAWDRLVSDCPDQGMKMTFGRSTEPGGPFAGILMRFPGEAFEVVAPAGYAASQEIARDFLKLLAKHGVVVKPRNSN